MRCHRGYTLIEILIVIAILASVVLLAAPLTGSWTTDANFQESEGQFKEAIGKAKSVALRNEMRALGETPVAAICISGTNALTVRKGATDTPPSCAATPAGAQVWQTQISTKVTIKSNSSPVSCICFNNKGLVTNNGNCSACASKTELELIIGSDQRPFAIF